MWKVHFRCQSAKTSHETRMKAPVKFLISGMLNTLLSFLAFYLVFNASSSVAFALVSGLLLGVVSSYSLNRYWVWSRGDHQSLVRFLIIQSCFLSSNWIILHIVSLTDFSRIKAQFFIYLFAAPLLYQCNKRFVFRRER